MLSSRLLLPVTGHRLPILLLLVISIYVLFIILISRYQLVTRPISSWNSWHKQPQQQLVDQERTRMERYSTLSKLLGSETLDRKLARIANEKNEVIITTATSAFADMFHNWYCSVLKLGAEKNLLIYTIDVNFAIDLVENYNITNVHVALPSDDMELLHELGEHMGVEEEEALNLLKKAKGNPGELLPPSLHKDVTKEFTYRTLDYQKLMVQRTQFINRVIKMHYRVLLVDNDAVWFGNPLDYIHKHYSNKDMIAQNDRRVSTETKICGCLIYMNDTEPMRRLWDNVTRIHTREILVEKKVLNTEQEIVNQQRHHFNITIQYLPMNLFPPGYWYFFNSPSQRLPNVQVIHNNWIVGRETKIDRFKEYNLWFISSPNTPDKRKYVCDFEKIDSKKRK